MSIPKFDRGSPVLIEVQAKRKLAFADAALIDVTSPLITILNPNGKEVVSAVALTNNDTGEYYYTLQTGATWQIGFYDVKVTATLGSFTDITIKEKNFELV